MDKNKLNNVIQGAYFFAFMICIVSCKQTASEQKTDATAKLAIRYLNEHKPDSTYALISDTFKKRIPPIAWTSIYTQQLLSLLPFKNMTLVSRNDSITTYTLDLKVSLNGEIVVRPYQFVVGALDGQGKMSSIALLPYEEKALKKQKTPTDNRMVSHLDSIVDQIVSPYIQTKGNVGISVGIWHKGTSFFYNYGARNNSSKILPTNHTLYDIGSITKTFTSTLLANAIEQKLLTMSSPIAKFLPDSLLKNPQFKRITFKQLANHTSGLPRDPDNFGSAITDANQPFANYGVNMLFSCLKNVKAKAIAKYEYSNLGAGLLGVLLEKVYHKSYRDLVREYITSPLKMKETILAVDTAKFQNLAQGYNVYLQPVPFYRMQAMESAGAMKSSTYDLITYAKAQLASSNALLDAALKLTHQITLDKTPNIVGLGWHYLADHRTVLNHDGGAGGYSSSVCIDLNKETAVVILTNNTSNGHLLGKKLILAIKR